MPEKASDRQSKVSIRQLRVEKFVTNTINIRELAFHSIRIRMRVLDGTKRIVLFTEFGQEIQKDRKNCKCFVSNKFVIKFGAFLMEKEVIS